MKTIKEKRTVREQDINSFGQLTINIDKLLFTTHYGTVDEMISESFNGAGVYVKRNAATEEYFPAWDTGSKYVVIWKGKAVQYAFRHIEIDGEGWLVPLFEIEE